MTADPTRLDLDPLRFSPSIGFNKIRIAGSIVESLKWPTDADEFDCWAAFTAPGELLCVATGSDTSLSGPLSDARRFRDDWLQRSDLKTPDIAAAAFATQHRVFTFRAKWLKSSNQLDLKLGSIPLYFLGWKDKETATPIFPAIHETVLALYAQFRFEELLYSPIA